MKRVEGEPEGEEEGSHKGREEEQWGGERKSHGEEGGEKESCREGWGGKPQGKGRRIMGWGEGDSYGGRKGATGLRSLLLGGLLERPS